MRTIELLPPGQTFSGRIQLLSGQWDDPASVDQADLLFLLVALASTEGVGGKKGSGVGRLRCSGIRAGSLPLSLTDPAIVSTLRKLAQGA